MEYYNNANSSFSQLSVGENRLGWLLTFNQTVTSKEMTLKNTNIKTGGKSAIDIYFCEETGDVFKITMVYYPYFLIRCKPGSEEEISNYLKSRYMANIQDIDIIKKLDLKKPNHIIDGSVKLLKVTFWNVPGLVSVRNVLLKALEHNETQKESFNIFKDTKIADNNYKGKAIQLTEEIVELFEYDIPYVQRVAIDKGFRAGQWYTVKSFLDNNDEGVIINLEHRADISNDVDLKIFSFDIETSKPPLKFPNPEIDEIMMISYMVDGEGFLITNRCIVSQDIGYLSYSPLKQEDYEFTVFNEKDEESLLRKFFSHIQNEKPSVLVTYNGDNFDMPYVKLRASKYGIDMFTEIGFSENKYAEYTSDYCIHMDCFYWVKRDSYLPVGSQGLKRVTESKLGYNPDELDPEVMTIPFIFSLGNIIPMNPDDVLRKGTGTLCEALLMVNAYNTGLLIPNKHEEESLAFYKDSKNQERLVHDDTYIGGHVESLEAGVFRSDLPVKFESLDPQEFQKLIKNTDKILEFAIWEHYMDSEANFSNTSHENYDMKFMDNKLNEITNFDTVKSEILEMLKIFQDCPKPYEGLPLIYHMDVASMYPNIILTNRLQPNSMIDEDVCKGCAFNHSNKQCDRRMTWSYRVEIFPTSNSDYLTIRNQLTKSTFKKNNSENLNQVFLSLPKSQQSKIIKKQVVCQLECPFYVDTVREFRDRRYNYKKQAKYWKKQFDQAYREKDFIKASDAIRMINFNDSLQLAHKCILNSFYGYVMRKGSRWYSMDMAGVVCKTGSEIIQTARKLIEKIGRPLELDTDGIWCMLPTPFPENFTFKLSDGSDFSFSYPCTLLNYLVHEKFTNKQYHKMSTVNKFEIYNENSIFFEVDGPYRAMILPASKEEDKLLKKRYAVFNRNGKLQELKGFELKRRGEISILKTYQESIFSVFLKGKSLEECYEYVGRVSEEFLSIITLKGRTLSDADLIECISEKRGMSQSLQDYGTQKSTSITTAKRMAEFLGNEVIKDKNLTCHFIISSKPKNAPINERAIPVSIFSAEEEVKRYYLKKWLNDPAMQTFDVREILDWPYYLERFGSAVQKLVTIPASMQGVKNPVPSLEHPEWLQKRLGTKDNKKQLQIDRIFSNLNSDNISDVPESNGTKPKNDGSSIDDIEDLFSTSNAQNAQNTHIKRKLDDVDDSNDQLKKHCHIINGSTTSNSSAKTKPSKKSQKKSINKNPNTLKTLFKIHKDHFDIIHVSETDHGSFKLWVLIANNMFDIHLTVPRVFYINSYQGLPNGFYDFIVRNGGELRKTNCTIPKLSTERNNMWKVKIPEENYQKIRRKIDDLLASPYVEGVYETQITLLDRALFYVGCTLEKKRANKDNTYKDAISKGMTLDDIISLPDNKHANNYLKEANKLTYMYISHIMFGDNQLFGIFINNKASMVLIGKGSNNITTDSLDRIYRDVLNIFKGNNPDFRIDDFVKYYEKMEFEVFHQIKESVGIDILIKQINQYVKMPSGPTVFIIRSPYTPRRLIDKGLRVLKNHPLMHISSDRSDDEFPSVGWRQAAARQMFFDYLKVNSTIKERIEKARFAKVPFCNVKENSWFSMDVLAVRRLLNDNMVLWCSSGWKPDLGGHNDEHFEFQKNEHCQNVRGIFREICYGVEINHLMVSALLRLKSSEHPKYALSYSSLINELYNECSRNDDPNSEKFLTLFEKWINDSGSILYDSEIRFFMNILSRDMINGFVKEIIKYGIEIIHCDFKRLVFSTKTNNADEAARCLQHVLALLKKDEFKYLVIRASETYSALIWLNGDNYVGIKGANEDNEADYDLNYVIRLQMVEKVNYIEDITKEHIKEFLRDFIFWCRDDKISPGELMTNTGNKVNSFIGILKKKSATLYISIVCTLLEMVVGKERSQQLKSLLCIMQGMSVYSDDVKNLSSKESHDVIGYACECGQVDNYHINNFECSYCNEDITNNKDFELFLIHYLNIQLDESSMTKGEEIIEKLQKFKKFAEEKNYNTLKNYLNNINSFL
ncbi:4566_t:CDS:10 [Entrophospora sp. SA101]|nr:4566_t:CDS:10 [Entrophospora sp. SA101]